MAFGLNPANGGAARNFNVAVCHFIFGLCALAAFAFTLPVHVEGVLGEHHYKPHTVAFTHLLVLGWISSIVMGAMYQLVPVALATELHSRKLGYISFACHLVGVCGMVLSFWLWEFRLLLWFGTSVSIGFGLLIYNMARTIKKAPTRDIVSVHIATSLAYIVLTFLAGQYLMHDKLIWFSRFNVLSAIHAHAHLAALGWFVLLIMGVGYRLLPMFFLTEVQNIKRAWVAYAFVNSGILGLFCALVIQASWIGLPLLILTIGLGLWFKEVTAMIFARKRLALDSALRAAILAVLHLPLVVGIGCWLALAKDVSDLQLQAQTSYALLGFFGFISLFIIGMLYKIIPFLVWYKIYPPLIGRQPVPKLEDLYHHGLQRWGLILFVTGTWSLACATICAKVIPLFYLQLSAVLFGCGALATVLNLSLPLIRLYAYTRGCPFARLYLHFAKKSEIPLTAAKV
jgi:hypothetical protein